jgi:putative PIN family toxin of toxin-antitoxin system
LAVVADTNILVSGLITPHGPPGRILDLILTDAIQVAFDDRLLDEYSSVLGRTRFGFQARQIEALLDYLEIAGTRVNAGALQPHPLPDPSDLPFIEVAVAARAEALITGNEAHFECLRGYGIPVLGPTDFLRSMGASVSPP